MEKTNSKSWKQSKTIWVNALMAGLVVLEANTNVLQPLLPVNAYALLAGLLPVVNVVLRIVTTTAITTSNK